MKKQKNAGNVFDRLHIFQAITVSIKQLSKQNIIELLGAVSFRVKYIYVRGRELHVSSCALMICVRNHAILVYYKGKTPLFDLIGCCSHFVSERQIFESFLLRTLRRTLFFPSLSALIKQHD